MPNQFTCTTARALVMVAAALAFGVSIAQTKLAGTQDVLNWIKPAEWTGNLTPSLGSASASIKVVFFVDYQCPTCRKTDPLVRRAVAKRPDVALIYRQFPLRYHPLAKPAAIVAENARAHGNFDVVHQRLMEGQELTEATIKDAARKAGVSKTESTNAAERIESDRSLEQRVKLSSVPTFVVIENGRARLMNRQQLLDFLE